MRTYKKTFTDIIIHDNNIIVGDLVFKINDCKILDLGCGDLNYANQIKSSITGIDIEDLGHNIVGDVCEKEVWNNIETDYFDLVMSLSSLHWMGKNINWLSETLRVLKKKGKFFHYFLHEELINKRGFRILGIPEHILITNKWLLLNENTTYKLFTDIGFNVLDLKITESYVNEKIIKYIVIIGEK